VTKQEVISLCVRNCCLDQQDICMGCFRHLDEIVGWQERSVKEKLAIKELCQQRRVAFENQRDTSQAPKHL
jgi:predicted Fe-S protein YdhL (DUF1289 family)